MWNTFIIVTTISIQTYFVSAKIFSYDNQSLWHQEHSTCKGLYQSPIHLDSSRALKVRNVPEISFSNYNVGIDGTRVDVLNNGYTIRISFDRVDPSKKPVISNGVLGKNVFVMEDIHFHWGAVHNRGTEHKMDGKTSSLEVHLVHRNIMFKFFEDSKGKPNGIVVLAVSFDEKVCKDSSLGFLSNILENVKFYKNSTTFQGPMVLNKIFPVYKEKPYFVYKGSLTTPVCDENVLWIVYTKTKCVSKEEVSLKYFFLIFF